jgi:hypothetical protein
VESEGLVYVLVGRGSAWTFDEDVLADFSAIRLGFGTGQ